MALDYQEAAKATLDAIGGSSNVVSAAHCATRLRLVISDNNKIDQNKLEHIPGAKGNFEASGQLQIIFGTGTVDKVYDEFARQGNISASSKDDLKQAAEQNQNKFMAAIKILSDVFVPIIPAIVASGMLMGIMSAIPYLFPGADLSGNVYWKIASLINACALANLQILLGFSAATVFGGNPYLGASLGALLISSDFINAYDASQAIADGTMTVFNVIPGVYSIDWVGYQGHVIPILVSVWMMSFFEKRLHKAIPEMFDLFLTPLLSVSAAAYITILFIGPIFVYLENAILGLLMALLAMPLGIGNAVIGLIYSPSVVTGLHQMYAAIDASMLAQYGVTYWLPLASAANIAQGGACLAVALKTRSDKTKSLAVPSAISCLLGITEPAIFGVNLPKVKPFVAGMIGAAVGAVVCYFTNLAATGMGVTGIFGVLLCLGNIPGYILMFAASFIVAFGITWSVYVDATETQSQAQVLPEQTVAAAQAAAKQAAAVAASVAQFNQGVATSTQAETIYAPCAGQAVPLDQVSDPVFASKSMGDGAAILPSNGNIYAPVSGTVTVLAETGHALGLLSDDGAEVLIHIGIDTVNLNGSAFTPHTQVGATVKKGDLLMEADLGAIKAANLDTMTMVIITNTDEYQHISAHTGEALKAGAAFIELS